MLRKFGALLLAGAMFASSSAYAATAAHQGALAPGKPAAVKQAEGFHSHHIFLWALGVGLVAGGIVLVATGNGHGTATTTTSGAPN
jgi:hypothetical protein